jgi:hypothetical protein
MAWREVDGLLEELQEYGHEKYLSLLDQIPIWDL